MLFQLVLSIVLLGNFVRSGEVEKSGSIVDKLERLELEGVYFIQDPNDPGKVLGLTEERKGDPPLKIVRLVDLKNSSRSQQWNIVTTGHPLARVAAIFNAEDPDNVLTSEYGFPGSKFTRAWHVLKSSVQNVVTLRNLRLCLTRLNKFSGIVDREECEDGKKINPDTQHWKLILIKKPDAVQVENS